MAKYGKYKFYHTSLDNLDFVYANEIAKSLNIYIDVLEILNNVTEKAKVK